jgi:hypothetical protein
MLTPEARHLVKLGNLDGLESIALRAGEDLEIAGTFEEIFEALDDRSQLSSDTVLAWGLRYLTWARSFADRDGYPILGTEWARRALELANSAGKMDLAFNIADTVVASYAPLERERPWWMKQRFQLASRGSDSPPGGDPC